MAILKSRDVALEINYLGVSDDNPDLLIAEVGLLANGVPILNDEFCFRMHTAKPGYFEFWQDYGDRLVEFLFERVNRNDEGRFWPQDEEDLTILVVSGWGYPLLDGTEAHRGRDMGEPTFTLLVKPLNGVRHIGHESAHGQGLIFQLHATRDELANFAIALQDELRAALKVEVRELKRAS